MSEPTHTVTLTISVRHAGDDVVHTHTTSVHGDVGTVAANVPDAIPRMVRWLDEVFCGRSSVELLLWEQMAVQDKGKCDELAQMSRHFYDKLKLTLDRARRA